MSAAPAWFLKALATPSDEARVTVAGSAVRYLSWGNPDHPGLVFVHGGGAHAHWWSFIAPLFSRHWRAIALDLTGHGDSGRREHYSHEMWADEVMAVSDDAGFPGPPVVVGHSLGGLVAIQTAATYGDRLAGAIIVDTPVRRPDPESEAAARGRAFRHPGTYPDLETAISHFKLVPPQPVSNTWIVEHIARHSLRRTAAGWTWKFDPRLFEHTLVPMNEQLRSVRCRVSLLRGEDSVVVPADTAAYMDDLLEHTAPVISIPEAHHHVMLDQPIAFVAALRALLADWEHSIPRN